MRRSLKKICIVFILAFVCLFSCACCKVSYTRVLTQYGQLTKTYVIDIDDDYPFKNQAYRYLLQKVKAYEDYYQVEYDEKNGKVTLTESYDTIEDYYKAYGITGDEPNEKLTGKNKGFFTEYVVEDITFEQLMSSNVSATKTYSQLISECEEEFTAELIASEEEPTGGENKNVFEYIYGTSYKNVSGNADSVRRSSDGVYMHTWTVNEGDFAAKTIYITQKSPNTTVWYAICIGAGLSVLAVAVYVSIRRLNKPARPEPLRFATPDEFMEYLANKIKEEKERQSPEENKDAFDGDNDKKDKGDE